MIRALSGLGTAFAALLLVLLLSGRATAQG
jgi:hypothetical protein